ncbi:MAG TPA: hypothetical protein VFB95_10090 [Candidatus Cryosericum sp.]|nr:hypothetical protein [Candidatus Cryosericum sp.]
MTPRAAVFTFCAVVLPCCPAFASQPEGYVGRLVPSPLVAEVVAGDSSGLPPVVCGGFRWTEAVSVAQLQPDDGLTFQMAIIPFRSNATYLSLLDLVAGAFVRIQFLDGLVGGLAYNRSNWNDVTVVVRLATQDFLMTVNGAQAGPFPFESSCESNGGCFSIGGFAVQKNLIDDDGEAWIDTLSLVRESTTGQEVLYEQDFNTCHFPRSSVGGILVSAPPKGGSQGPRSQAASP